MMGVIKGENSSSKISTETSSKSKCKKVLGEGNEDLVEGKISSKKKTSAKRNNEVLGKGIKRKSEEIEGGETPSKPVKLKEEAFNKVPLEVEATKKEALLSMRIKGCTFKEEAFDKVPLEVEETLKREVLLSMKIRLHNQRRWKEPRLLNQSKN